jgi:hypothetical protein
MREWTCTRCGSSATAADRALLEAMGWRFPPDAGAAASTAAGVCPPCDRKERESAECGS